MTDRLITPPVEMAVSLDDARRAARADGDQLDTEIEIHVRALTAFAEHYTGRALINRTWRVTVDSFIDAIRMPESPVSSVASVKSIDTEGVEQTLSPADYFVDDQSTPGYIVPGVGKAWPDTQARVNAVAVTVVCGYGPDHTTTPPAFKGFIIARLKEIFGPPGTKESEHLVRGLDTLKVY